MQQQNLAGFIWSVADMLWGNFRQSEYGKIVLPFALLRRLECVLEPTRDQVLAAHEQHKDSGIDAQLILPGVAGQHFYNTSKYSLANLGETETRANLEEYIARFSANTRDIFENFEFGKWLDRLVEENLLYMVVQKFAHIDLHPDTVSNHEMGLVFEELIRKFAESSNDEAGQHFTPRDVVRLATTLLFAPDEQTLSGEGVIQTIYDPCCGTGGFLSSGMEQVHEWNPDAVLVPFGQELNAATYAIAMADMMIKGKDPKNICRGNTLSDDQLPLERFNYCLANPPFGIDWKKVQKQVAAEHKEKGHDGRFGPGLPRVSDGALLFLMHLIAKMQPVDLENNQPGSRIAIVLNGSPLFTGGAGGGESEIRRWVLENDWLEAIVALPTDLFYNTGIATYVWLLSNHKAPERKGQVQLIDATSLWKGMPKSLGSKRRFITEEQIGGIARQHAYAEQSKTSRLYPTTHFGYRRITVERPLQLDFEPQDEKRRLALTNDKGWDKLSDTRQHELIEALNSLDVSCYMSRPQFMADMADAITEPAPPLTASEKKLLQKHIGKHNVEAEYCRKGDKAAAAIEPNPDLRDFENVPLGESVFDYFAREVTPHVHDAWIDETKVDHKDGEVGVVGYEINFNRYFYEYQPPRPLAEIDAELKTVEREILELLGEVTV